MLWPITIAAAEESPKQQLETCWLNGTAGYLFQAADFSPSIKYLATDGVPFITFPFTRNNPETAAQPGCREKLGNHIKAFKLKVPLMGRSPGSCTFFPNYTSDLMPVYNFLVIRVSNSWVWAKSTWGPNKSAKIFFPFCFPSHREASLWIYQKSNLIKFDLFNFDRLIFADFFSSNTTPYLCCMIWWFNSSKT